MSPAGRWIIPIAAGALAAGAAFAVVTVVDDGHGDRGERPGHAATAGPGRVAAAGSGRQDSTSGRAIYGAMGCGSCHRLAAAGSGGQIGPDLDERLPAHNRASLIAVIKDADRGGSFVEMPEDFGKRLTSAELDALVDFLLAAREQGRTRPG
jgi:mono/diheme cytochrome c family protein